MRDRPGASTDVPSEPSESPRPSPEDSLHRLNQALALEREALREIVRENRQLRQMSLELLRSIRSLAGKREPMMVEGPSPVGIAWTNDVKAAEARLAIYQRKLEKSMQRHTLLRSENTSLVARCQELMKENNSLFKLYVASHHLHSSLDLEAVMRTLSEIIVDIIGASDHAIFLYDPRSRELVPAVVRGLDGGRPPKASLGQGPIGLLATGGESYVVHEPPSDRSVSPDRPLVAIALRVEERLIGVVAIYGLVSHKPELTEVDYALFDFFAAHAATAIQSARMYAGSEAKVTRMKEFMTLMKPRTGTEG